MHFPLMCSVKTDISIILAQKKLLEHTKTQKRLRFYNTSAIKGSALQTILAPRNSILVQVEKEHDPSISKQKLQAA